VNSLI